MKYIRVLGEKPRLLNLEFSDSFSFANASLLIQNNFPPNTQFLLLDDFNFLTDSEKVQVLSDQLARAHKDISHLQKRIESMLTRKSSQLQTFPDGRSVLVIS